VIGIKKRFSKKLDPAVDKALQRTIDYARESISTIPDPEKPSREKKEIISVGQKRFENNTNYIWPEVKKLVEMDFHIEEIRQMLNDFMKGEGESNPLNDLPEDVKKELKTKIDEAVKKAVKELEKEIEEGEKSGKDVKEIKGILEGIKSGKEVPYPIDELSDDTKKELEKLFNKLPRQKREELGDKAKKQLEDLEDAANKGLEGKLNKDKPESHQERREREAKEKKAEKDKEETERERKELEKKLEELRREKMTEYDKAYEEVADIINSLYSRLARFFLPERHPKWQKGYPTGSRLDVEKAMQAEADPRYLDKIWERKTIPHKFDYRFSILVDLSGSMQGEKIEETFKGVVVLAEVLEKLGIQYEILGFQDEIIPYKDFKEKLTKEVRERLLIAKREPFNNGVHNKAGWSSDGYCLKESYQRLLQNLGKDNFLIVLSDGMPEPDSEHSGSEYDLDKVAKDIIQEKRIKLIGLGLGPDTEHVKEYYPHGFANMKMKVTEEERRQGQKDFTEAFADLLEDMIKHPENY